MDHCLQVLSFYCNSNRFLIDCLEHLPVQTCLGLWQLLANYKHEKR